MLRKATTFGFAALLVAGASLIATAESSATPGFCAFVYLDENCDGIYQQGIEPRVNGWEICWTGPGNSDCGVTGDSGQGGVCWLLLPVGNYHVCITPQVGWINTTPICVDVLVEAGQNKQVFFGVIPVGHECPTGACCFADGHCEDLSEEDCLAQGGTFYGDGTECLTTDCPQPPGACCFPDGSCLVLTEEECLALGGTYYGDFTDCDPNLCAQPIGACCFPDGSCLELTEEECIAAGGTYYGDFSDCDKTQCPQPTGACCFPDGSCVPLTEEECLAQGGDYLGDNVECGETVCPTTPTREGTWGAIKHTYR